MKKRTRQYWVDTLALFDPKDVGPTRPRSKVYMGMVKAGIPFYDRVAINREAAKLYRERRRPAEKTARLAMGYGAGVSRYGRNLPKYGGRLTEETAQRAVGKVPELAMGYCGDTVQYAEGRTCEERRRYGNAFIKFNTEGEKQMEKIDWHKPLRCTKPGEEEAPQVATFKSGKQRVVWIDDRVYPVDEQGRAVAAVDYGLLGKYRTGCHVGQQLVENVPEEKFFLGLGRNDDGTYWLTKNGHAIERGIIANYWAGLMKGTPHWIVDTRKSAEPPKAIVYNPRDWTVVTMNELGGTYSHGGMTETEAETRAASTDGVKVRVRTTPAPVDTARYIQLYRGKGSNKAWAINWFYAGGPHQEATWAECETGIAADQEEVRIKVRD